MFIALLAMAPQMIFGLILAFLLNQHRFRGGNLFKTIFYFPNLVTAVSLGVLFSLLFDFKAGSVNKLLMALHIIAEPVNWKMNGLFTQLIVAFVLFWQYFGYYTIIFTAGIKGIPYDIMEAAEVDGANKFQTFFHIVLPQLRNILCLCHIHHRRTPALRPALHLCGGHGRTQQISPHHGHVYVQHRVPEL